jgi:hypothetical protein
MASRGSRAELEAQDDDVFLGRDGPSGRGGARWAGAFYPVTVLSAVA